ncbi:zincin [Ramicandelaber brevisporus]|nr:zincin [Ramicandelaber brevisporus]
MVRATAAPLPRFDFSPAEIASITDQLIAETVDTYNQVGSISHADATFESAVLPLGMLSGRHSELASACTFLRNVSMDKAVRDASTASEMKIEDALIELGMREDVYKVTSAVAHKLAASPAEANKLSVEDKRLLEKINLGFKRNGLDLPEEKRQELKTIQKRLSELSIQYSNALAEVDIKLLFTKDELEGMPESFLEGLETATAEDGSTKFVVTTKYPHLFPILKSARREETRKTLLTANDTKCPENSALLAEAVELRRKHANILGYAHHAAYKLEEKMAKDSDRVKEFLRDLHQKLVGLGKKEIEALAQLKNSELAERGLKSDGKINSWDFRYYINELTKRDYAVDEHKIKEYYTMENVTNGMLDIYQTVLGLRFVEVSKPNTWHQDVRLFEVWDNSSKDAGVVGAGGGFIGHFYLDLHPRDNKYNHAAVFPLRTGVDLPDSPTGDGLQYPVAAMVANFTKPTASSPSLLDHSEIVTYFHELGHVMHHLCSRTKYGRFHGFGVQDDFVEAPSQMLENWCWDPVILTKLSGHFQRPNEKIPRELVDALVRTKNVCAGLLNLRQLHFGIFDMTVHLVTCNKCHAPDDDLFPVTNPLGDLDTLWSNLRYSVALVPDVEKAKGAAGFGHIMGGYDVGYYGYLWSQVFSADMFYARFKADVMNKESGLDYRRYILQPGGGKDANELLVDFLGREPTSDAFLDSIGLTQA